MIFDGKSIVQVSFKSSDLHTRLICTHSAILAFMRDARFILFRLPLTVVHNRDRASPGGASINFKGGASSYAFYNMESF